MTNNERSDVGVKVTDDTLDRVLGLAPGSPLYELRQQRTKVVNATQASENLLIGSPIEGLSEHDRLLVALLACTLTPAPELALEYRSRLEGLGASASLIDAVISGQHQMIVDRRLRSMLTFTQTLITDPVKADRQALLSLKDSGLSTPQITALAQLIAFVSYQVRVFAGLSAFKASGDVA